MARGEYLVSSRNILILLLTAFALLFILQNIQVVDVRFLFWKLSMSRALMLLGTFGVGVLTGWLAGSLVKKKE